MAKKPFNWRCQFEDIYVTNIVSEAENAIQKGNMW